MNPEIQQLADELGIDYATAERISYLPRHEQEMAILDARMERANALRDTAMPEGREAGNVYVAANPLEFIGRGIQQYRGGKRAQEIEEARQGALDKEEEARRAGAIAEIRQRKMLLDALRGPEPTGASAAPVQGPPAPTPAAGAVGGGGGAPAPAPQPQPRPVPQISPVVALRGAGAAPVQGPPVPRGAQAAPVQGPPEPGWFDRNPARRAMRDRLNALRNFEGFARRDRTPAPSGPPGMGDRPAFSDSPYQGRYPWPGR